MLGSAPERARPSKPKEAIVSSVHPTGLHHVTAIATDPQRNLDFYHHVLGLRLVKQTVNFDAPDVYHLYYGNQEGTPGTVLTFFPWPDAPRGRRGAGQTTTVSFSVPEGSLGWWRDHLARSGVEASPASSRFEEESLTLRDPDGLALELVAHERAPHEPWEDGPVPAEHGLRGFHSVTLTESDLDRTGGMLLDTLGFDVGHQDRDRARFHVAGGAPGEIVNVVADPHGPAGLVAAGTVHHIAWRAPDDESQARWRGEIVESGVGVTDIIDRRYFHSIYFREPGGVLFEIATDPPGFTIDEPLLELGRRLRLPPWLEPQREQIQRHLPALKLPDHDGNQA
jgi:glyoxalase family protein